MRRAEKAIWMLVTNDRYELPVLVCDSAPELAEKSGFALSTLYSIVSRNKKRKVVRFFADKPYTVRRVRL